MTVDQKSVERFGESLARRGKQPSTVESYCRDAQRFLDYLTRCRLPVTKVEPETLIAYQDHLRADLEEADNSVRRTTIGVRQFFRYLTETKALKGTPFDAVPIPERDERLPKGLDHDDVFELMTVALAGKPPVKAHRDATIVAMLAHEGLKANELINLRWSSIIEERGGGSILVGGGRSRSVPLSKETRDQLKSYREAYQGVHQSPGLPSKERRVFVAFKGRDAASSLPDMTRHGLKFILYELGEKAGVKSLNTEALRHYAVSHMLGLGLTPDQIMERLGLRRMGNIAKHLGRSGASSS